MNFGFFGHDHRRKHTIWSSNPGIFRGQLFTVNVWIIKTYFQIVRGKCGIFFIKCPANSITQAPGLFCPDCIVAS